jgi:hypothetical protein
VLSVAVLGLLEVMVAGRLVVFTAGRLQTLLAVLAMSAGETVSLDYLATAVWEESLPADVRKTVQTYVTRHAVRGAAIRVAGGPGDTAAGGTVPGRGGAAGRPRPRRRAPAMTCRGCPLRC